MWQYVKRFLPTSLFGRALLILFLPMVLVQVVATYIFYDRHWESIGKHMANSLAGDVALAVQLAQEQDTAVLQQRLQHFLRMRMQQFPARTPQNYPDDPGLVYYKEALTQIVKEPFSVHRDQGNDYIITDIYLPEQHLQLTVSKKRVVSSTTYIFIMWMVGTAIIMLIIATVFLRNQIRPITRLAAAAEAFGKGRDIENFKPRGAREVRRAGAAFLNMKERITRQISTRTEMLAAISHDLRTPLTRMKLELAMLPPEEADALQGDVQEMEHMIEEYLRFARGEGPEQAKKVNVNRLLSGIVGNYARQGKNVELQLTGTIVVTMRENAMRRCLSNLLDNALRYAGHVRLSASRTENHVSIMVDDDGPGIPETERQQALQAFCRLDPARNQNRGGAGLGLTIAQDIVLGHGGHLELGESPLGGLRVELTVPF